MSSKLYTIEIVSPETGERIDFGTRKLGDIGRDILVVKRALNAIVDYASLVEAQDNNPSLEDPDGWFDCTTGRKISKLEAATFDASMQSYLKRFQIENQFYILSYLFSKITVNMHPADASIVRPPFGSIQATDAQFDYLSSGGSIPRVPTFDVASADTYSNNSYVSTQIDLLTRMFELEFGVLGEATLAVLHGWLPRSAIGETGYYHESRVFSGDIKDVVLLGIYEALVEGLLTQRLENSPDILEPRELFSSYRANKSKGSSLLREYNEQAPIRERVKFGLSSYQNYVVSPAHFAVLVYKRRENTYKSPLYTAFAQVSVEQPKETSLFSKSTQGYKDSLRSSFEPNPLIDPDPFALDEKRICVFDITDYTLENLPPFINETSSEAQVSAYNEAIAELEDKALTKALEFYGKPTVWFLNPTEEGFSALYGDTPSPSHRGIYTAPTKFSLTTEPIVSQYEINRSFIEDYRKIEYTEDGELINVGTEPMIKFVEFKTPSLRPGDNYRAKFIINRDKFNSIVDGIDLQLEDEPPQQEAIEPEPPVNIIASCDGSPISEDDRKRRYEEYRALASQKKREIARTLREKTLENYNNKQSLENASIDLGVFGNANLNLETDSYEFTTQAISSFTGLFSPDSDVSPDAPKFSQFTELSLTYVELEKLVGKAGENLKKAFENCRKKQIKIKPSDFNANSEASSLQKIPGQLKKFITKRNKEFNFGSDFDKAFGSSSLSEIKFEFKQSKNNDGLVVKSLKAGGKLLEIKNLEKEVPAFRKPRTVGYMAQLFEMVDPPGLFSDAAGACEDLGIGKKGLAYIMKHTMSLSGEIPEEFNPINEWVKNEITDPFDRWKKSKEKNTISNALKLEFGSDEVLSVFGNQCKQVGDFFEQFANKFSIPSLLCDYLKCIKLPAVNFSRPNFKLPPNPDLRIFGWYAGLVEMLYKKWDEILAQFLCAFAKKLLDILTVPFCQEQLRDQLYGAGSQAAPEIQRALVDGLTDLSISPDNVDKAKDLIDEMAMFLTGEELCRVLQGGAIDAPTMNMILRLATRLGIEEVDTEETLRSFFETISIFLPDEFCENLNQSTSVIGSATCKETSSYLDQIRRRMLASDATDDEIEQAVDMARKNLMGEAEAFQALGESGLEGLLPPTLEFGNPEALISELPEVLSEQINRTARSLFESAKMGYVSSLSEFGPALYLRSNRLPLPTDPEYNQESSIIVQTILENLKLYTALGLETPRTEEQLTEQLCILYQVYELEEYFDTNGKSNKSVKVYSRPENNRSRVPQNEVNRFSPVTLETRGNRTPENLFLKPVGFSQSSYYYMNEDGVLTNFPNPSARPRPELKRLLGAANSPLNEAGFNFIGAYKIIKQATVDEVVSEEEGVKSFLREKISERLRDMQMELQVHLQNISTPVSEEAYLKILRDHLNFSYENERERGRAGYPLGELVDVELDEGRAPSWQGTAEDALGRPGKQAFNLKLNIGPYGGPGRTNISLYEFESTANTNKFDPYIVDINDSALFLQDQRFEYCDTIPGPGLNEETITEEQAENREMFERSVDGIPPNIYTRKELFARKFWDSVISKVNFIYERLPGEQEVPLHMQINDHRRELNLYQNNFLRDYLYGPEGTNYAEGIFEQILFSLRDSRIYDEDGYSRELRSRVNGEAYFSKEENCYKNRYNISQFGILSFEKMITDELANQINKELQKPENEPYNLDFDDPSPIEKAIQNVSLIGFIRVCIVELILKGSLAYSVWDVESVSDEPFMQDFILRYVEQELNRHESISDKWEDIIARVTGIEQPAFALRDMVQKQVVKVQGVSKRLFQNDANLDYYNWFIKYFVPQTEVSRNIANRGTAGIREGAGRVARDPATGRIIDRRYEGQRVDERGNLVEDVDVAIEGVPDKFYWDHPLLDPNNITEVENSFNELRDPVKLASDLLGGHNPFFHIEHCIEVVGPMAHLETLVLPGAEIVDRLVNGRDDGGEVDNDLLTNVSPLIRTPSRLSIRDSFERFTNLGGFPNPADYSINATPVLPENARGSTVEESEDLNLKHELYHIDDFIDALDSVWDDDDLQKFFLHMRGLMHYDPNAEDAPGGLNRNTLTEAANAYPETIRRSPTRFIKKIRRVYDFSHDFVSHNTGRLFETGQIVNSLESYHADMNDNPFTLMGSPFIERPEAIQHFNNFKNFVSLQREHTKYHILPTNGEEILQIQASGITVENSLTDETFQSQLMSNLGQATEIVEFDAGAKAQGVGYDIDPNSRAYENKPRQVGVTADFPRSRGFEKVEDLNVEIETEELDRIDFQAAPRAVQTSEVFKNPIGTFEDAAEYEAAKELYGDPYEETWVESVYTFTGEASIIAGLHGSFSIGETFDPAVLNFEPSQPLKAMFEEQLKVVIDSLQVSNLGFENAVLRTSGEDANGNPLTYGTKDPRLTQYGRTFFTRRDSGELEVFLARPMGIDKFNNKETTRPWLTQMQGPVNGHKGTFKEYDENLVAPENLSELLNDARKIMHELPSDSLSRGELEFSNTNLLPPNFYKIPMRVLITQVYAKGELNPQEVYCKVVPPEYIRNLHESDVANEEREATRQGHINALNATITEIAQEYVEFVAAVRERIGNQAATIDEIREEMPNFPDFTTDFTRAHLSWPVTRQASINADTPPQWCSIERIYSRVFAAEVGGFPESPLAAVGTEPFNSDEELDKLFKSRGYLMINRFPEDPHREIRLQRQWERPVINPFRDKLHFYESCNYFYQLSHDALLTNQEEGNNQNFNKTIFSLKNIFQWYLKNRRKDTLWGAITPTFGAEIGAGGEEAIVTSARERDFDDDFDRGEAGGDVLVRANKRVFGRQKFPLAQSFRGGIFGIEIQGHVPRGVPMPPYWKLKNIEWAARVLPKKKWHAWGEGDVDPRGIDLTTREVDYEPGRINMMHLQLQPGYVTLYPDEDDVKKIEKEGIPHQLADDIDIRLPGFDTDKDLKDWVFYEEGTPGLSSDGTGRAILNYNRIESTPIRNTGGGLFYASGMPSHTEISNFIGASLKRFLDISYDGNVPDLDPVSVMNVDTFFSDNIENLMLLVTNGLGDRSFSFDNNEFPWSPNRLGSFDPIFLEFAEDAPTVNRFVESMFHVIDRLCNLVLNKASFHVKSEVSEGNSYILEAPYKLSILRRFLVEAKKGQYTPEQKLFLVGFTSIPGIASTLASLAIKQTLDARPYENIDNIPEADLEDWAAACLHYLASRLLRGEFAAPALVQTGLDQELAGIFTLVRRIRVERSIIPGQSRFENRRFYINAPAQEAGWPGQSALQVQHIGGTEPQPDGPLDRDVSWENVKTLVRDIDRHGLTPSDIIRKTNLAYHIFALAQPSRNEGPNFPGEAGLGFANNDLILEALLDTGPESGDAEARMHPAVVAKYGDHYREALQRIRDHAPAAVDGLATPEHLDQYTTTLDRQSVTQGRMEHFITRLDQTLMGEIFGIREPFESAMWILEQLSELTNFSMDDAINDDGLNYNYMLPRIIYGSSALRARREQVTRVILEDHVNTVNTHRDIWNTAFGGYSGITPEFLSPELLRSALVNGRVVRGLLERTTIAQVARLVSNSFIPHNPETRGGNLAVEFRQHVLDTATGLPRGIYQDISEEFRSFVMASDESNSSKKTFSVPIVEYRKLLSTKTGGLIDCVDLASFRDDYKRLQPWMAEQLIELNEAKQVFEYIYPVKRFQAVATAFVTSALAGYSSMPTVMQTPKASLAALVNMSSMTRRQRTQLFDSFSQSESFKQTINNTTSNPKAMECFDFPYPKDFLDQLGDTLEQLFKEFPSLFFRGIAEAADPAYKEMKMHWENCDIDNLGWKGVQWGPTIDEKDMTAGLMGKPDGERDSKYAMIIPSAPVDISVGAYRVATNPFSRKNWRALQTALDRTIGYIYKGPIALADGAFNFSIPCRDGSGQDWPGRWPKPFNKGRYGHPLSPLTAIALTLPELKGEKRERNNKCSGQAREINNNLCANSDVEESPFGSFDDTEEE